MFIKRIQSNLNFATLVVLLSIIWHAFSIHGFAEALVYCVEDDGQINIESKAEFSAGFETEMDLHFDDTNLEHKPGINRPFETHQDYLVSESCVKDNRVNRFEQVVSIQLLKNGVFNLKSQLPDVAFAQSISFIPPIKEQSSIQVLQSIILII